MDEYKHYIRVNSGGVVVHGYTTGFEQPIAGDLLLTGQDGRHFQTSLTNERNQYKYKIVSGQMVERTQAELDAELNTVSKRRQVVLDKWDPQIDAQRETLRKLQDEDKPAAAITKAKTNIHNLVASKNTELAGVV